MPIDGLVSGLDTTSIISQLMEVEKAPQTLLTQRKTTIQATIDAYASIRSRLTAVDSAANALRQPTDWQVRSATADSTDVTVSATSVADLGSLTMQVSSLATRHSVRSGNTIAATTDVIVSGGTLQITDGDGVHDLAVGGGTLSEVVAAINTSELGLSAAAVNTGSGYRLQITARSTGADAAFSVSGGLDAGVGGTVVAGQGTDAELTIGSGPGAYTITSSSNTFSEVLPGLTITARAVSTSPVTVTVADDVDALIKKVQSLVDAANAARAEITTRTAYNAETKKGASLAGDPTARRLAQDLTRAVIDAVGSSALGSASSAGISVDRFGKLTFDTAKFRSAYESDADGVSSLFTRSATTTGDVTFVGSGDRTAAGSHTVEVTAAATAASTTGLVGTWPLGAATTVSVRIGTTVASYEIQATDTDTDAVAGLQAAIDAAGLQLSVSADGGGLKIDRADLGSASTFDVAWDGTTFSTHRGTDIVGTIDGIEAIGVGSNLTVAPSVNGVGGLTVGVTPGVTGSVGSLTYQPGVAQRLTSALDRALDSVDGYLSTREDGQSRRVSDLDASIKAYDVRLAARETRLRLQFSQLEVAMSELSSKSSWLSGQLSGLSANSSS